MTTDKLTILTGDALLLLPTLPAESIDACVTDPPYELGFMGKAWDSTGIASSRALWREILRVLKPGAHLLSFGGSRTYHRMACAIEDAGFEIRDQIMWIYGSGFPKSHNLSGDHEGWGTALKPAHEPIVMARKPFKGTVAQNMAKWGVGAINIEDCRVPLQAGEDISVDREGAQPLDTQNMGFGFKNVSRGNEGRWPANVIHDGSGQVLFEFAKAGVNRAASAPVRGTEASDPTKNVYGKYGCIEGDFYGDNGTAARFYYCAKASRADRNVGCEAMPDVPGGMVSENSGQHITRRDGGAPGMTKNNHPTVKPTELMQYLCRMVCPQGGTIIDQFAGSGSTGRGALLEGFNVILIEKEPENVELCKKRCVLSEPDLNESK